MEEAQWPLLVEELHDTERRFLEADRVAAGEADSSAALSVKADLETVRRRLREIKGKFAAIGNEVA